MNYLYDLGYDYPVPKQEFSIPSYVYYPLMIEPIYEEPLDAYMNPNLMYDPVLSPPLFFASESIPNMPDTYEPSFNYMTPQPTHYEFPDQESTKDRKKKVFNCSTCNRQFSRKYDMIRHVRVHTGIKPYACPFCHKQFARSDARVRHFRIESSCKEGINMIQKRRSSRSN